MKVGGLVYLLQNGMDDSPMYGNEFPGKNFPPKDTKDIGTQLPWSFVFRY